ncbi:hypothetical protein [Winogradskyella sp.]|nr:hypothetical protein [Winogradskyella sp.]
MERLQVYHRSNIRFTGRGSDSEGGSTYIIIREVFYPSRTWKTS